MKRFLNLSILVISLFLVAVLFLQNGDSIEIEFLIWRFNTSIAAFTLFAVFMGSILSSLFLFPMWLKKRNESKSLQKELMNVMHTHFQSIPNQEKTDSQSSPNETKSSI